MKKAISVIGLILMSLCCLFGCGNAEYKPRADEIYFEYRGNYRIIELSNTEPESIENFPLINHTELAAPSMGTAYATITDKFAPNSVFFPYYVNESVAYKIINILHYSTDNLLTRFANCGNIPLWTLNKRIPIEPYTHTLNLTEKPYHTVYGEVATVTAFTFNYADRKPKDGSVIDKGSFKVYVNGEVEFKEFVLL